MVRRAFAGCTGTSQVHSGLTPTRPKGTTAQCQAAQNNHRAVCSLAAQTCLGVTTEACTIHVGF